MLKLCYTTEITHYDERIGLEYIGMMVDDSYDQSSGLWHYFTVENNVELNEFYKVSLMTNIDITYKQFVKNITIKYYDVNETYISTPLIGCRDDVILEYPDFRYLNIFIDNDVLDYVVEITVNYDVNDYQIQNIDCRGYDGDNFCTEIIWPTLKLNSGKGSKMFKINIPHPTYTVRIDMVPWNENITSDDYVNYFKFRYSVNNLPLAKEYDNFTLGHYYNRENDIYFYWFHAPKMGDLYLDVLFDCLGCDLDSIMIQLQVIEFHNQWINLHKLDSTYQTFKIDNLAELIVQIDGNSVEQKVIGIYSKNHNNYQIITHIGSLYDEGCYNSNITNLIIHKVGPFRLTRYPIYIVINNNNNSADEIFIRIEDYGFPQCYHGYYDSEESECVCDFGWHDDLCQEYSIIVYIVVVSWISGCVIVFGILLLLISFAYFLYDIYQLVVDKKDSEDGTNIEMKIIIHSSDEEEEQEQEQEEEQEENEIKIEKEENEIKIEEEIEEEIEENIDYEAMEKLLGTKEQYMGDENNKIMTSKFILNFVVIVLNLILVGSHILVMSWLHYFEYVVLALQFVLIGVFLWLRYYLNKINSRI